MASNHKIILVGGGTAGHVLPLLAVAENLKKKESRVKYYYLGSGQNLEKKEVSKRRIKYIKILGGKWRRNLDIFVFIRNIFDLAKTFIGFVQSVFLLLQIKPAVILSKGGFVCVPVSLAAGILKIPLIIHESDLQLGLANKIALRFASRIATAFPIIMYSGLVQKKAFYSGIPLREDFVNSKYKISNDHILITGGSLGARRLNEIFFAIGEELLKKHKVVHITGKEGYKLAASYRESLPRNLKSKYQIFDYTADMAKLVSSAKLIISRAGASSIFEIGSFAKKAILVPIEEAVTPHQRNNALILKEAGFVEVFDQNQNPSKLLKLVEKVLHGKNNTGALSFKCSADLIADTVLEQIEKQKLNDYRNIFMVGVEGVSMKGLKYIFERMGKKVTGSDAKTGGHLKENITDDLDLVVYSSAITKASKGYLEVKEALNKKIPIMKRSEAIGLLMKGKNGISVSGMHGKTTISLLLARIFELDSREPTYLIGAPSTKRNPSFEYGRGKDFIAEACEYDDSFLNFSTSSAIISNIEREHLDYFNGGLDQIKEHFVKFCQTIRPGGVLVYCIDDVNTLAVVRGLEPYLKDKNISLYSYGFAPGADFRIRKYKIENNLVTFDIKYRSNKFFAITGVAGEHFALNVTAAFALSFYSGVDPRISLAAIANFKGAKRRMEFVARAKGASFYDDYGHHPTEIRATTKAFFQMFKKARKILIYEPHQQKRFDSLYNDFYKVFEKTNFDLIGILPVHKVEGRDSRTGETTQNLVKKLNRDSTKFVFLKDYPDAVKFLENNLKKGDIVVTMGATDVYKVTEIFLRGLKYE